MEWWRIYLEWWAILPQQGSQHKWGRRPSWPAHRPHSCEGQWRVICQKQTRRENKGFRASAGLHWRVSAKNQALRQPRLAWMSELCGRYLHCML